MAERVGLRGKRSQSSLTDEEVAAPARGARPRASGRRSRVGAERVVAERVVTQRDSAPTSW